LLVKFWERAIGINSIEKTTLRHFKDRLWEAGLFCITMPLYGYINRSITNFEHCLSIMANSDKVPNSRASKGTVSIRLDSGSVKACFPRTHFADEKQLKLATGIPNDANWEATANNILFFIYLH
jgi:hypothetical protein